MEGVQEILARAGIFQGVDPEAVAALGRGFAVAGR